ncbi:U3 small nucleolar RNA-associated protein MPP10 [Sphaceloma murrayae]|uniref:U3 small nucleolar ribonucleoprotein protein MPP10 n=1 Tax=Sphaceloma murrayae TaxID=2082308 RepID=A0A2K1QYP5_9PEZI|nr:U3 small nucleolar RNA-associated protein MPP10 [Sphaceloma murrayae]
MAATQDLPAVLSASPSTFLTPPPTLHPSTLSYISALLTPLATRVSTLHDQRTAAQRQGRKRKRSDADAGQQVRKWDERRALKLRGVYTEGFGVEQVWEQVRRVVGALEGEVTRDLEGREERAKKREEEVVEGTGESGNESELGEEGIDFEIEGVDDDEDARYSGEEDMDEEEDDDEDEEMLDGEEEDDEVEDDKAETPATEYVEDPNGLNDGFFSIDDFNKQSDFLEKADARGDDDGAASDEEEVDWNTDPMAEGAQLQRKEDAEEDGSEEDGPTFGNMDLNAPEGESDDDDELEGGELDEVDDVTNANNLMYQDFFAPPAKKGRKNKKGRPHPHNFPATNGVSSKSKGSEEVPLEPDADYNESALSRIHRDLFSDEDLSDAEEDDEPADVGAPARPSQANLSSHERRRLALQKEISTLESTLISSKPWALSGEASSSSRPLNSLLEEDLAFDRTGKPVPVITAEVSSSLETLIKARIVARDFQDIYRRRPDDLATGSRKRDAYELSDAKSKKSLAELYEEEHLQRTTGAGKEAEITDAERKEQAEILNLWNEVRAQLDSLSNFTLRPKAQHVGLEIRSDVAVAKMEDARPNAISATEGGTVETSQLGPGEVFKIQEGERGEGEMLAGGRKGVVLAKDERERGEGKRARRRAKERGKKRAENRGGLEKSREKEGKDRKEGREEVLGRLKKGGVKVIGKKGELTDVDGGKVKEAVQKGAGAYKL